MARYVHRRREIAQTMLPFAGLLTSDFDAYLPARATSNAFVRPRLSVKERLLAVGRALHERAARAATALDLAASDERPSVWNRKSVTEQWVFLSRDRAAREQLDKAFAGDRTLDAALADPTPFHRHAFLGLRLDATRFDVTLRIHRDARADVLTLRRRIAEHDEALAKALGALPAGFRVGVTGDAFVAAEATDPDRLGSMLEQAVATGAWLSIERSFERDEAVAMGAALGPSIEAAFDALLPLYARAAWAPDDTGTVPTELARERAAREVQAAESAAREAAWHAQHEADIAQRRELAVTEARERALAMEPARPAAVHAAVARVTAPARVIAPKPARPVARPPQPAPARPVETPVERKAPTEWIESHEAPVVGAHVRIRAGHFAGRSGTVVAIDARGEARVVMGSVTTRIGAEALVTLVEKR